MMYVQAHTVFKLNCFILFSWIIVSDSRIMKNLQQFRFGAVRTKSRKIDLLLPLSANTGSTSTSWTYGHTINSKNLKFSSAKKCGCPHLKNPFFRKMPALDNPPLNCRRSLWTAPFSLFIGFM